jgi:hypothetical protein
VVAEGERSDSREEEREREREERGRLRPIFILFLDFFWLMLDL